MKPSISAVRYARFPTPLGPMLAASDAKGLIALGFQDGTDPIVPGPDWSEAPADFAVLAEGVGKYLAGRGRLPKVALGNLGGTLFQRQVWRRLQSIPFGSTRTYGEIAGEIKRPKAFRAVGAACGANPVPLFIPCHRVLGGGGVEARARLGGFSCGIRIKARLLELEGVLA